jgi:hypothetical protein
MSANGEQRGIVDVKTTADWWRDPHEVIRFARVLVEADQLGGCQHRVISFFESPWGWDNEHRMWCEAGRPHSAPFKALCSRFNTEIADDHAGEYASPFRWRAWSVSSG